jgi:hypothetical protein
MVSMGPNTQRYDLTYQYTDLCNKTKIKKDITGSIYDLLQKDGNFSRTLRMIDLALLKPLLSNTEDKIGLTIFVTSDDNITNEYMEHINVFRAETLINSYILEGVADFHYFIQNGSSVFFPRKYHYNNPILMELDGKGNVFINRVGKIIRSISAKNGYIHVLDHLADVSYLS